VERVIFPDSSAVFCCGILLLLQVLIYKWVPIIGPVLGSAFVIGLYVAARLLKGDLTDRMKLMDEVRQSEHCSLSRCGEGGCWSTKQSREWARLASGSRVWLA
jgi:hypothetical protein